MRTASRIALVLTGMAAMVAALATSTAHADRSLVKGNRMNALTAQQRPLPQQLPDRIDYVRAARVISTSTAIAHLLAPPEVANLGHGDRKVENEFALARDFNQTTNTSDASPAVCDGDTFAAQQRNASDGGRGQVADRSQQASCLKDSEPKPGTRQAIVGDLDLSQIRNPEPEPVVVKFEAVIKIDLAGLNW